MIKQLFLGVVLGICAVLFFAQFDSWVHEKVGYIFTKILAKTFHCDVSGTVTELSFFPPSMTIKDVSFSSTNKKENDWSWGASTYITGFSWGRFLLEHVIDMWISMDRVHAYSGITDGKLAIFPHIIDLMKGPQLPIPLFLQSVCMRHAHLLIDNGLKNSFYWNGESQRIGEQLCSKFYIYDGMVSSEQMVFVKNIVGTVALDALEQNNTILTSIQVDGRGYVPQLREYPICFCTGKWRNDRGRFHVHNADYSLHINPLIIAQRDNRFHFDASIEAPMSYVSKLLVSFNSHIHGIAHVQLRGDLYALGDGEGHLLCEDVTHDWLPLHAVLRSSFIKHRLKIDGTWNIQSGMQYAGNGIFSWNGNKEQTICTFANSLPVSIPLQTPWSLDTGDMQMKVQYDKQKNEISGDLLCRVLNSSQDTPITVAVNGRQTKDLHVTGEAIIGDYHCAINAWNYDEPRIDNVGLFDNKNKTLLLCEYEKNKQMHTGFIDIALLRLLGITLCHYDVHSKGMLLFEGNYNDHCLHTHIQLQDATIRLPQTLNFMHGCTASCEIDTRARKFILKEVHGMLHSGTFYTPIATVTIDNQGNLSFVHVPFIIDRCLFTLKHDLFAMISGSLLLQKNNTSELQLTGNIILDRAQFKENLFSASVQKKLLGSSELTRMFPFPLMCDLTLETKEPIRVDTQFLEANAQLWLRIQNSIAEPMISGFITVPSGLIQFPYKPLHLTKGDITFLPEQPFNPLVEIVAKNKIKNHRVSLHVTGSLQDHLVMLESTPPLTEEQIVGLLVAGAHEESLQALIPSLLMQNVTNYLFSSHKSNFFDHYIKPWMKQINVHLMPNFSEQSGRGGLRGALEITVNDRWRALIEKNFTLTEDTRFELEYTLSDDVTFRLVRDERCDIGAEVEMRWKF